MGIVPITPEIPQLETIKALPCADKNFSNTFIPKNYDNSLVNKLFIDDVESITAKIRSSTPDQTCSPLIKSLKTQLC